MTPTPPLSALSEPAWGHKLTVHIYYAGQPTQESLDAAMDACGGFPGDPTFVGMDLATVQDEPKEQMGT